MQEQEAVGRDFLLTAFCINALLPFALVPGSWFLRPARAPATCHPPLLLARTGLESLTELH